MAVRVVSPSLKNLPTTFMGKSLNMAGRYTKPAPSGRYLPPGRTQSAPWMPTMPTTFMGKSLNMAGRYGKPGSAGPGPKSQPQAPATSGTTVTPAAPAAPATPPAFDPNSDPIYAGNIAAEHRTTTGKIAGLTQQVTDAKTALPTFDYTTGIENPLTGAFSGPGAALARQYGLAVLAQQIANARHGGGGASASLGQRIGAIGQTFTDKKTAALDAYQKLAQRIGTPDAQGNYAPGTEIAGALGDESLYDTGQRGEAVTRASQAAQNNPTIGGVAPPAAAVPGAAPPGAPAVGSRAGSKGAIVAPYGANKPAAKAGFRTVGVGNGRWIYVKR